MKRGKKGELSREKECIGVEGLEGESQPTTGSRHKNQILLAWSIVAVFSICFFLAGSVGAQEVRKLRFAAPWPAASVIGKLEADWCKEVEKRTNGRVTISYFPAGILVPPLQALSSLEQGVVDIASSLIAYHPGRFPILDILEYPLGCRDSTQAIGLANALVKKFNPKELETVHMMFLTCAAPKMIFTRMPVTSLDDIKGKRVNGSGTVALISQRIGAIPVTIPLTEMYDSMSKGIFDGYWGTIDATTSLKLQELAKSAFVDRGSNGANSYYVFMNKKKWGSLPQDIREIIEKVNEDWVTKVAPERLDNGEKTAKEACIKAGVSFVKVSETDTTKSTAAVKPMFDSYIQKLTAKGLLGADIVKFCRDYIKAH